MDKLSPNDVSEPTAEETLGSFVVRTEGRPDTALGLVNRLVFTAWIWAAMCGCSGAQSSVEVRDACNTFVAESSPRRTPEMRIVDGKHQLVVSLTPAASAEAKAVLEAAASTAELVIIPSGERIRTLGLEDGRPVLEVSSSDDVRRVLDLLCFFPPGP